MQLVIKEKIIKQHFKNKLKKLDIRVINTGINTMTGGRIKRLAKLLNKETFLLTYGDGLSDVNLKKLIKFHRYNKKLVTLDKTSSAFRLFKINWRTG